jgi:hypothetical protein
MAQNHLQKVETSKRNWGKSKVVLRDNKLEADKSNLESN